MKSIRTYFFQVIALLSLLLQVSEAAPFLKGSASPTAWPEWQEARTFFEAQQYAQALQAFQAHPRESDAHYHYNLGTTYYHLNQWGPALAHLEKANRLSPHDPDIQTNLHQARLTLEKQVGKTQIDSASSWLEDLADRISLDEARATLGLVALLITLIWIRAYWKTRNLRQAIFQPAGYIGLLALLICTAIYSIQRWAESSPPAIVLEQQILRSGPGKQFMELGSVSSGAKIRLLGQKALEDSSQEEWQQIRFSSDSVGWIKSSALLTL